MNRISELKNRAVLSVSGNDAKSFLQGLVTNDIQKLTAGNMIYALMLTPQGRFLYDFFITERDGGLLLDVQKSHIDAIMKKLKMYKLRAQVDFALTELRVYVSEDKLDELSIQDPRSSVLGYRTITSAEYELSEDEWYHKARISAKIPDADMDMEYERSLPMEMNCDKIGAIDFQKGCYVGQEVTSRMRYRANIRKTLYVIESENQITKGSEVEFDGRKLGVMLGGIENEYLALFNIEEVSALAGKIISTNLGDLRIKE
jgi:tRNA-modifying protein YgfZ